MRRSAKDILSPHVPSGSFCVAKVRRPQCLQSDKYAISHSHVNLSVNNWDVSGMCSFCWFVCKFLCALFTFLTALQWKCKNSQKRAHPLIKFHYTLVKVKATSLPDGPIENPIYCWHLIFFLNGAELSLNSVFWINRWSMNWAQFKDPDSHMCLSGTVVAS